MNQSDAQLRNALNKIRNLIGKSVLDNNIKDSILVPIPIIEDKIKSQQIHVGLVGESAHDSVTVLNSILNTDFFKLGNSNSNNNSNSNGNGNGDGVGAANTRRLVRTLIEHAPEQSLAVTMYNGKVYNTRNNMLRLTRRFLPDRYDSFSFIDKIKYFFGIHKDVETNSQIVSELYHNMVSSVEAHQQVSSMRLGLPLESLPDYLVIVDTPSYDANNDMNQRVIKETLKILCDELILMTPAENPLSDNFVSFLKGYLYTSQASCQLFVTGLEKYGSSQRRAEILFNTAEKADTELQIQGRNVIMAPALLDLALRGLPTQLSQQQINAIPEEERDYLLQKYKRDIEQCFITYNIRKETAVVEKKFSIVEDYIRFIRNLIADATIKTDQEKDRVRSQMVPTLSDFLTAFNKSVDVRSKTKTVEQNLHDECRGYAKDFIDSTFALVDQAALGKNPKDAVQGIMKESSVIDSGNQACTKCYQSYIYKFDYIKNVYRDVVVRLESDLRKTYGFNDVKLKIGERMQPIAILPYNMVTSKANVTTFRLKRIFTSVSTIQAQMKQAIQDAANKFFNNVSGTYGSNLDRVCRDLDYEEQQIRMNLNKKYKNIIDERITSLQNQERILKNNISSLGALRDIVSKVIGYDVQ